MKRQIFIGDVQGCCSPLERLLEKLRFDPSADRLRFAGDLVNRGGESLASLRLIHSLRESAMTVLGNHDLHLLAYAFDLPKRRKVNPEFEDILDSPEGDAMLEWLRSQPLMWKSKKRRLALVHAGIDPRWGVKEARDRAREVEQALGEDPESFFTHMYGDRPRRWRSNQPQHKRMRAITNVFTRMRFCDHKGRLELDSKCNPERAPKGYRPWFEHVHPEWTGWSIVFGHWSLLGLYQNEQVTCLDTGCVWGGSLTALVVDDDERRKVVSIRCGR